MSCRVRRAKPEDLLELVALERASFATPWSQKALRYELEANPFAHLFVLELQGEEASRLIGYGGYHEIVDECEVTNICIHPLERNKGLGKKLMFALLKDAKDRGLKRAVLEVRVSNAPAIGLYAHYGFTPVGLRHGYYPDNGEDALIMAVRLVAE